MAMAITLLDFLEGSGISYEEIEHPHQVSSTRIAQSAHVPGRQLAKAVLLKDERGMVLCVLPSNCLVDLDSVDHMLGRKLGLAREEMIGKVFDDCEVGAMPPMAAAWGLPAIVDPRLDMEKDIYFEAGDHRHLVKVDHDGFEKLTHGYIHADIGVPVQD